LTVKELQAVSERLSAAGITLQEAITNLQRVWDIMNRPQLKLKVVRYLQSHGLTMTIELADALEVQRSTLAFALAELRASDVIESSQGIPGVKLNEMVELTCGRVLGTGVPFVDPQMSIDKLP
jgi:predicted transcriptional regulator